MHAFALVVCLLLACTFSAGVRLSLHRVTSKTSSHHIGSRHFVDRQTNRLHSLLGVVSEGFFDETYQVDVSVGTPPQAFNLTLDTFRAESFLFASDFSADQCMDYTVNVTRRLFDPSSSKSHTVHEIPNDPILGYGLGTPYVPPQCGDGDVITDKYSTDTFQIGNLSVENTPFVLAHKLNAQLNDNWPSDGIFGLALWDRDLPTVYSTVGALTKAAKQPIISTYLTRPTNTSQLTERGGALVLGGKDSQNCDSVYSQWIPVDASSDESGWGFSVDSFSIGSYAVSKQTVQLQSHTTFIYAPTQVFNAIVRKVGAEYDFRTDRYTVKCDKAKRLPNMVFTFGSFKYTVPATDYVRLIGDDYTRNDGLCTLAVKDASTEFFKCCDWVLGTTVNFEYCHLLDYGRKGIAFAKALTSKSG